MNNLANTPNISVDLAFIGGIGTTELIIILVIILILFGAGKLPGVGSAVGKTLRNFKKEVGGGSDSNDNKPAAP